MAGVMDLLDSLSARVGVLGREITDRIRAEVPGYATLPYPEHARDVQIQIETIITGIKTGRPPPAEAVELIRAVGRRRAACQLSLPDVVEAYHIAYREIWNELLAGARRHDPDLTPELAAEVAPVWLWFHRLAAAMAEGHASELRTRAATRLALRRQFLEALTERGGGPGTDGVASALGFDPDGEFTVACAAPLDEQAVDEVDSALAADGTPAICVHDAGRAVLISQGPVAAVPGVLPRRHRRAQVRVGTGLPRPGVAGAAASFADAADALGLAQELGRDVRFADDWLLTLVHAARPRLGSLLARGAEVAAAHPRLAETVRAYAGSGYSVSACARLLHIHPNTAKYRLDRWQELTGWDIQAFPGLAASMICLGLPAAGSRGRAATGWG
jgi:PucR C-terminal helix-turn-helix domain/GGDEF-like domain